MARTATKEPEKIESVNPSSSAKYKNGVIQNRDNWPVVITLAATNSPDQLPPGAMTAEQASLYVQKFQDQGWRILSSNAIQSGDVNGIYTLQVYYCLIKE